MGFKIRAYFIGILFTGIMVFSTGFNVFGARIAGDREATPSGVSDKEGPGEIAPAPGSAKKITVKKQAEEKAQKLKKGDAKKHEPSGAAEKNRFVTIDFDGVDIKVFIKFISELTGRNFVIDKAVRGEVTVISPTKISIKEAYKVFESVLEVHGYTVVPAGEITKIVPAVEARHKDIETRLRGEVKSARDRVVTQVIPLKFADPEQLKRVFTPMVSKSSVIVSYPPTGMLIITDVLSNIKRLLTIINAIDVEGVGEEIAVIPLEYATASTLSKSLDTVFTRQVRRTAKGAQVEPGIKVVPDERTNSLILLASEDDTRKVKKLVRLLDKETPKGEGNIHVHYLQNANAEELAKVLMAIPSKQAEKEEKGKAPVISKEVQVVADKSTNSLVINAKKEDFAVLEEVIEKLDIPRMMVYIEALIMEVNADKDFKLGVEWMGLEDFSYHGRKGGLFSGSGGKNYSNLKGITGATPTLPSGFSLGVLGEAIQIGSVAFPNLGAVLQAYRNDSDVHIISTPQILTTDNEEAKIAVGQNVPYLTKDASGEQIYQTYEYKDVGVTLKITPQINQERFVRLNIFQEVIKLKKGSEEYKPTTLKRSAETTAIVKDANTVVIGGIIGESTELGEHAVPCLGDIPGLGWFFKSVTRTTNRTNLFVFLTPHIIENPSEANDILQEKKKEVEKVHGGAVKLYKRPGAKAPKPVEESLE